MLPLMNLRALRLGFALLVPLFSACEEETPEEKCEAFYELVCDRLTECAGTALPSDYEETCIDALESERSCSAAVDVSDSYDTCIDDFGSAECNTLFPINPLTNNRTTVLPSACRGAIKTQ